jgi:hypothetical protein
MKQQKYLIALKCTCMITIPTIINVTNNRNIEDYYTIPILSGKKIPTIVIGLIHSIIRSWQKIFISVLPPGSIRRFSWCAVTDKRTKLALAYNGISHR